MNKRISISHIFAANPLDRGERERRDEEWISRMAKDRKSKLLLMHDLNVPITPGSEQGLAWLGAADLKRLEVDAQPMFLGS